MKRTALLIAFAIVAAACTGAVSDGVTGSTTPGPTTVEVPAGDPAPAVTLEYFDGTTGTLADFEGRPVVLNFWASWCPACVAEMPDFEAVHQRFGDDVVFVGIDLQDVSRETAQRFIDDTGVTYPIADDATGEIYAQFGGFAMPTTVFIDADGNIVGRQDGAIFEDQLNEMVSNLFGVAS